MNKDQVTGKIDQAVGKVKRNVGEAVGNDELANKGVVDRWAPAWDFLRCRRGRILEHLPPRSARRPSRG
jgi:hypothetical protein